MDPAEQKIWQEFGQILREAKDSFERNEKELARLRNEESIITKFGLIMRQAREEYEANEKTIAELMKKLPKK